MTTFDIQIMIMKIKMDSILFRWGQHIICWSILHSCLLLFPFSLSCDVLSMTPSISAPLKLSDNFQEPNRKPIADWPARHTAIWLPPVTVESWSYQLLELWDMLTNLRHTRLYGVLRAHGAIHYLPICNRHYSKSANFVSPRSECITDWAERTIIWGHDYIVRRVRLEEILLYITSNYMLLCIVQILTPSSPEI